MTAIVKATFRLLPDGPAAITRPDAIRVHEDPHGGGSGGSLRSGGDLAPHRPRADVVFVGHAHASGGAAVASSARLAVFRERALVDKTIHVYGDWSPPEGGGAAGPGAPRPFERMPLVYERAYASPDDRSSVANPVGTPRPNLVDPRDPRRPIGFGPIAGAWPIRARLLDETDRRTLDAPVPELSEAFDWRYFQVAPPDQQVDALHGDEWIVLDGLHPTRPRLQTRLPSAAPVARVHRRAGSDAGELLPLMLDTLAIDGDEQSCSLVWRGSVLVPEGEAALPSLQILVGLKLPNRPAARAPAPKTVALSLPDHLRANASPALPFAPAQGAQAPPRPISAPEPEEETVDEPPPLGATIGVTAVSPLASPFPLPSPGTSRPPPIDLPGAPWAATAAPRAPEIGDGTDGTMLLQMPAEMRAFLDEERSRKPTPPPVAPLPVAPLPVAPLPLPPAEMRARIDEGRPEEPAVVEPRTARRPALPLKGTIYGKPRRKSR